jgi:predicted ribosomally synthesized peptide with SipW-like signal peptide
MEKKNKNLFIIGLIALLILVIGGTYAYFSVNTTASTNGADITGSAKDLGTPAMKTVTSNLYLNLNASLMSQDNAGKTYFANSDSAGTALTTNPNYTLAEVSLTNGTNALDCTYNFKVTATVTKTISDGSDSDVKVVIGDQTLTLNELITAGTNGVIVSGKVKNLVTGTNKTVTISSSVTNTANTQDNLIDNTYTITVEPYSSGDTKAFSCKLGYQFSSEKSLAQNLIDSDWLWQSGLEGDGYRFTGSGEVGDSTNPNNFVCFGTTDKDDCTSLPETYMYRIIGVFEDENGDNHVKLITYTQLYEVYAWHSSDTDVDWADSDLYKELNGSYFLTNTDYDYMQDNTWLNKITDWKWSAVNTKTYGGSNGPNYFSITAQNIYLHEMDRTGKTSTIGEWTTPTAKIGLMYASDYALSLGQVALSYNSESNYETLQTGWMHQLNNDTSASEHELTISRGGCIFYINWVAWCVTATGHVYSCSVDLEFGSRPVFYLTSDVKSTSGTGTIDNPYILEN